MTKIFLTASVAALALASPVFASNGPGERGRGGERAASRDEAAAPQDARERGQGRAQGDAQAGRGGRDMQRIDAPRPMRAQRGMMGERQAGPSPMRRFERAPMAERMIVARPRMDRSFQQRAFQQRVARPVYQQRIDRSAIDRRVARRAPDRAIERLSARPMARIDRIQQADRVAPARIGDFRAARVANSFAGSPRGLPQMLGQHDMGLHRGEVMRSAMRPRVRLGERLDPRQFSSTVPLSYRTRYVDTPDYYYRYDDNANYLYRVARGDNLVRGLIPLYGGYSVGDPWRDSYQSSYVPAGYRSLYYDTPDYNYRYGDNAIYRVDAGTQLISAVVALLTGQNLGVGQMLPSSYGVYNVPYDYRSSYYDTPNSWYRYNDGMIYQVDPYSRQIEASYPLYGDDYAVGSPWPAAYPDYNVPYGYRSSYYDTPQDQYRYANGGIYQVDPKTRLIEALVSLVTGRQFAVGQPMPAGYGVYNVPYDYRDRYADTADNWYRYNDGYVYQVDPRTSLVEQMYRLDA